MTKGVWRHALLDACTLYKLLYHVKYHDATQRFLSTEGQEHMVFVAWLYAYLIAVDEIESEILRGTKAYRHEPLLAALPLYFYEPFIEEEVGHTQTAEFAHSQSATEQHLDYSLIARTFGFGEVDD